MSRIFHKDNIFNDPEMAAERYRVNPEYFAFPERLTVEVTNRCNLECFMCPRNKIEMESGAMDMDLFKRIIDEASRFLPVSLVPFFRGEALLHPRFIEMLRYARKKGLGPIQLGTNAHLLTDEVSKGIIDMGIDFISFSVDAMDRDLYSRMRGSDSFKKVFSNILKFIEAKNKKRSKRPEIQISCVKTEENREFVQEFVAFWKDRADRVRIYSAHSLDGRLGHLKEDIGGDQRRFCLKILTDMVIYWNGDVAICNHDWKRDLFIGNVNEKSIREIWRGRVYDEIRRRQLNNDVEDFLPCRDCSHWKMYYTDNHIIGEVYEHR